MSEQQEALRNPLTGLLLRIVAVLTAALAIYHIFNFGALTGYTMLTGEYIYGLLAMMLPMVYIAIPAGRGRRIKSVPWYDWVMALASGLCCIFFIANQAVSVDEGWEYAAPQYVVYVSLVLWALALEATRRCGGWPIFVVVFLASVFPIFAGKLPDSFAGISTPIDLVAIYHTNSDESLLGIPSQAFANLVIGFLLFGIALQRTGGGKFFIDLAFALLGKVRGGPAKVSIFSSGLMGSMSGSVVTNVLTTGPLSIPAMRKVGFSKPYAAGVETCASTGGVLMPPVMGATAFVMATFLDIPYGEIALAAAIPSALYFFGLFVQIDFYSARNKLKGLPAIDLPRVRDTLKEGWHYIFVFAFLIWMLLFMKQEAIAPFYATALLIVINQLRKHSRWRWKDFKDFAESCGALFAELTGLMAGVGLIMGALAVSGMSGTIANDLLFIAGGDMFVLLLMGALTSFILGIGMPVTAAYIFLAIALAPALINGGMNPMAVHMFILYWGMLSFITPPVAIGAFAAASVAGSSPMKTSFVSMQMGSIIYFIPFFFVLEPALLLQGDGSDILLAISCAVGGILLVAGGLQGYLPWLGDLSQRGLLHWPLRLLFICGGLLLAMPHNPFLALSEMQLFILSFATIAGAVLLTLAHRTLRPAA
ncbi:TRAP transporter permease [Halopseudomonas phragmitis]|uniref:C4-dicarboxylate ABC transporter n=2 Tax=Pseudomonadaceae TaxID=135621 RepID=A0A1V0B2R7_9GAMM|nr:MULTISPECIES: TRAP transporter permease [Pseudomonadaceae]AQZ94233.1 C4-dicarboxylate ABC transporter [Halopseudomonas phragmitis]RHW20664.1 TRAP transporter permease [Pseudomonas jilinensis]